MTQSLADSKKDLMRYLIEQVKAGSLPKEQAVSFLKVVDATKSEASAKTSAKADQRRCDIAIVGMACRFPEADNKEQFWQNLAQGKNSIRPFPAKRREQLSYIEDDEIELFHGGFLDSVEGFDTDYFNIPPAIARHMDPYHRIFLQNLVETIEDAGYHRGDLQGKNIGIYAGNDHTHRLFCNYLTFIEDKDFNSITGSWTAVFASRLAYLLNLQGPALVIDTSCSSGLVAMDYAIKGLNAGDCEAALVGAANLFFAPGKGIVGDVENDDFMVRTFDNAASGTVWGEGVASVMLKTLEKAEQDGDAIYAVVKGIAVNNDGASNGITAPNARAQQDVLLKAWNSAGISPEQLSYIESHGTGTNLGDPIEIRGLSNAVAKHSKRKQFCGIGSVKTNIGHTVATAGLASLCKVLLSYREQQLPPSLNFNQPNLFIDFANCPVYVNDQLSDWPAGEQPRYAGVSSFSLSGTNCHVVLQDWPSSESNTGSNTAPNTNGTTDNTPQLLVLSARNDELMKQTAQRYLDFVEANRQQINLAHLCFTAAAGREHHALRVAMQVTDVEQVVSLLGLLASERVASIINPALITPTEAKQSAESKLAGSKLAGSKLDKRANTLVEATEKNAARLQALANCYVLGARISWHKLFSKAEQQRVHLPAQPFQCDDFWLLPAKKAAANTHEQSSQDQSVPAHSLQEHALQEQTEQDETLDVLRDIHGKPARISGLFSEERVSEDQQQNQQEAQLWDLPSVTTKFVAYVIAETLGYTNLTAQSDYYALGGDSVTGTKITFVLSDLLQIDVQPNDLLSAQNLGDFIAQVTDQLLATPAASQMLQSKLARFVSDVAKNSGAAGTSDETLTTDTNEPASAVSSGLASQISPVPVQDYYPLSRAQNRMFVLAGLAPESTAYNVNAVVEIPSLPDFTATKAVFNQLIARHESLRTGFVMQGETPVQVIAPGALVSISHHTLPEHVLSETGDSANETDANPKDVNPKNTNQKNLNQILQQWAQDFIRPFDLSAPPLMRIGFASSNDDQRHFMIIDMHHIITDGASMGWLIAESMQLAAGETLPALTLQYKDFAHWHNQQQSAIAQQHESYWQARFSDPVPEAQLPLDYSRPAFQQFQGQKVQSLLSHDLLKRCKQVAASEGVSLFMLLSAVFRVLMAKYQVADDLVLGTPVAGRSRREWQRTIGMFVNTVALRFNVDQSQSFSAMLSQLKQQTLSDFAHQDYPFEELPELLNLPRNSAKNPLFDIYFVLQNQDMGLDGDGVTTLPVDTGIARFDLTVVCRELKNAAAEQGMTIDWEFAVSLFKPGTIQRMAMHFEQLLNQLLGSNHLPVHQLSCLSEQEQQQIVVEFNNTATEYQADLPVQVLFEQQAARFPDKPAVQFIVQGDQIEQQLSYSQLNERANQLAHAIMAAGVKPNDVVALLLPRHIDTVVAILATLKAGATYVPLDPANPPQRSRDILQDCTAKLLLSHNTMAEELQALAPDNLSTPITLMLLSELDLSRYSAANPEPQNSGNSLIYLMYTSGTTGKPKGAKIRHKSVNRVVRHTNYLALDNTDVCLLVSSFAFDGCVLDLYGALLNGGTMLLTSKADTLNPPTLAKVITSQSVTSFFMTTSLFNIMVDNALEALKGVKYAIFGGEAGSADHVNRAYQLLGPGKLINGYGPTESTVFAACLNVQQAELPAAMPIGPAVANTRIYILDRWMQPVPNGIAGEIYIGGDGIADGYLNREQLTAERFIASPFVSGDTLYRTGDLGRFDQNGCITYMGRIDLQVKIRGFRIELDEIKAAILQQPGIADCVVTADPDSTGTRQLLSWIVRDNADHRFTPDNLSEQLTSQLQQRLPDYMIPRAFTLIDTIPVNNNGKLDKATLPAPALASGEKVAARDELEQTMLSVFQEILQTQDVGVTDSFFAVGGDSIKGIQVVARLQEQGVAIDTATLFQHQNIAALAQWVNSNGAALAQIPQVPQTPCTGELTLSPIQHWFMDAVQTQQLKPAVFNQFNQAMIVRLDAPVPEAQLSAALQQLVNHHDMLRVAFDPHTLRAEFLPVAPLELSDDKSRHFFTIHNATLDNDLLTSPEVQAFAQHIQQHIDIEQGRHIAAGLIVDSKGTDNKSADNKSTDDKQITDNTSCALIIAIHHLVVDVLSWNVLLNDLMTLLSGSNSSADPHSNQEQALPAKTLSQQSWNATLSELANSAGVLANKDHWLAIAAHDWAFPPPSERPGNAHLSAGKVREAQIFSQTINANITEQLLFSANHAFTTEPQHLLLSALALAYGQVFEPATQCLLNLESFGRDAIAGTPEPGRTVGWFTSTSPFVLHTNQPLSGDLIKDVKERLRRVPGNGRDFGLLRWLSASLSHDEQQQLARIQPQIGFNYLGVLDGEQSSEQNTEKNTEKNTVQPLDRSLTTSGEFEQTLPLDWVLFVRGGRLTLELMVDSKRVTEQQAQALQTAYSEALAQVAEFCVAQQHSEKTATDFTVTDIGQDEFDDILDDIF